MNKLCSITIAWLLALTIVRADDPKEVVRLARMQERELREWLRNGATPGNSTTDGAASFGAVLEASAATLEAEYGVPIDVVRVRDCPATGLEPLMLAARTSGSPCSTARTRA